METSAGSDKGVGLGLVFGVLGVVGSLVMLVTALQGNQVLSGWGFAAAMIAGGILVATLHLAAQPR